MKTLFTGARRQALQEVTSKPLILKRLDKTSWLCPDDRWSVEAIKVRNGVRFIARDLRGKWKAGPFDNWHEVITAMEKKTKRKVQPEGVRL